MRPWKTNRPAKPLVSALWAGSGFALLVTGMTFLAHRVVESEEQVGSGRPPALHERSGPEGRSEDRRFEAAGPSEAVERFEEDEERIHHYWETAMTPEEYRNALVATGMAAAKEGAASDLQGAGWVSIGPVGGITNATGEPIHSFNGRLSGIDFWWTETGYYVYVGACSGGLWRAHSTDGAGVWTSLGDNLPNPSVRAFSINWNNIDDILVGTGDLNRIAGSGMYRTLNGGASWSQISLPANPMAFGRIHRSYANPDLVVACCMPGGVLRSTDGGATWQIKLSGSVNDMAVDPTDFNIQYAMRNDSGAFKSTDAGNTWSNMNVPMPPGVPFRHAFVAVCRDAPQNVGIFVSWDDPSTPTAKEMQVLRSTDGGASWSNITGTLGQPGNGAWEMNEFSHTGAITFRPNNPDEIFVGARGYQRTTDNGASWHVVFDTHADITQLRFADQSGDDFLWILMDGGVIGKDLDGPAENWNGDDVTGLRCYQVDFLDAKRGLRAIGTQDNGVSYTTNAGGTWYFSWGGDGFDCEIVNDLTNEFWHASGIGSGPAIEVYRQTPGGLTYTNNQAESMDGLFYHRQFNWMTTIGADDVIWGCDVGGSPLTWVWDGAIPPELAIRKAPTGSYVDGRTIYANTADPTGQFPIPVVMIARLGGPWQVSRYDFGGTGGVNSIYASTENAGEAWAAMGRLGVGEPLIFHTRDYGTSWTDVTGNLTSLRSVRCVVQKPFEPHVMYAGTDIGVFLTTDGGATWQPFQTGLPIAVCTDMRYVVDPLHGGNDRLVVATYGRGIYEREIASFPIVYVHRNSPRSEENGTYDHPYDTFDEGLNALPYAGSLGLYGDSYTMGSIAFSAPMTLRAYGGTARLGL